MGFAGTVPWTFFEYTKRKQHIYISQSYKGGNSINEKQFHLLLLVSIIGIFSWSVINPRDLFTWFLEVLPAVIGLIILVKIYPTFKFTCLTYFLMWIHAVILMVGGHYTYAEMPLFNWLRDTFELSRNYYDRLGHFAQGFIPAIITRELLIRTSSLKKGRWIFYITISVCLAISAAYELLEFAVALFTGTAAEAFLGTQGDVWDTQWDMSFALIGAFVALMILGKWHDRLITEKCTLNPDKK